MHIFPYLCDVFVPFFPFFPSSKRTSEVIIDTPQPFLVFQFVIYIIKGIGSIILW